MCNDRKAYCRLLDNVARNKDDRHLWQSSGTSWLKSATTWIRHVHSRYAVYVYTPRRWEQKQRQCWVLDHSSCASVKLRLCGTTSKRATGDYNGIYARLAYELRDPSSTSPLCYSLTPLSVRLGHPSLNIPSSSVFFITSYILLLFLFAVVRSRFALLLLCACVIYLAHVFARIHWANDFCDQIYCHLRRIARRNFLSVRVTVNFDNRYFDLPFGVPCCANRYGGRFRRAPWDPFMASLKRNMYACVVDILSPIFQRNV